MIEDPETGDPNEVARQTLSPDPDRTGDRTLDLAEETLQVDTQKVVTGTVRVRTVTREHEELVSRDLASEAVEVTRVPIGREVASRPEIREENGVTIIPVVEEVLVVETRLVLKEEVHVRRTRSTQSFQQPVVLRRQEAVIERLAADGAPTINEETIP